MFKLIKNNILSILVALFILYLSMTSPSTFEEVPLPDIPHLDKIIHFGMYFVLMTSIITNNRRFLNRKDYLFLTALIPFFYGLFIEILQATVTVNRSGSIYDIIFNSAGILSSVLFWLLIRSHLKESIR